MAAKNDLYTIGELRVVGPVDPVQLLDLTWQADGPQARKEEDMPLADLSFSGGMDIKCPSCAAPFTFDRVLVADLQVRPDLRRRIDAGTLHAGACPHCGRWCAVNGPALLLSRDATPHLVFVCESADAPGNDHDVAALFTALRSVRGPAVLARWTAARVLSVEHRFLPYLQRPWVRPGASEWVAPLQLHLLVCLQTYLVDHRQVGEVVNVFPDLLSPGVDDALVRLLALARERSDGAAERAASGSRSLLSLIRAVNP
jgi:hypothetical protein